MAGLNPRERFGGAPKAWEPTSGPVLIRPTNPPLGLGVRPRNASLRILEAAEGPRIAPLNEELQDPAPLASVACRAIGPVAGVVRFAWRPWVLMRPRPARLPRGERLAKGRDDGGGLTAEFARLPAPPAPRGACRMVPRFTKFEVPGPVARPGRETLAASTKCPLPVFWKGIALVDRGRLVGVSAKGAPNTAELAASPPKPNRLPMPPKPKPPQPQSVIARGQPPMLPQLGPDQPLPAHVGQYQFHPQPGNPQDQPGQLPQLGPDHPQPVQLGRPQPPLQIG